MYEALKQQFLYKGEQRRLVPAFHNERERALHCFATSADQKTSELGPLPLIFAGGTAGICEPSCCLCAYSFACVRLIVHCFVLLLSWVGALVSDGLHQESNPSRIVPNKDAVAQASVRSSFDLRPVSWLR